MKKIIFTLFTAVLVTSCNNVTELPQVTTINPNVSDTAAIVGGDVTYTGGDANTTRGVCWSTSPNPTTGDNFRLDQSNGSGVFTFDIISQLTPNTNYYFKAYAENSVGKTYGNQVSIDVSNDTTNSNPSNDNPYGARINSRGCVECDNYVVGESFMLNGVRYEVADRATLISAIAAGLDLSRYCTSRIVNMYGFFANRPNFNQDIGNWDVSNVTDMTEMFYNCSEFNQDIGSWDVSSVGTMRNMFRFSTSFNQDIGDWNVSSVTDMDYMFYYADSLNQDLGDWDVSNVTSMAHMFRRARSFNQDIGNWDVSNVTDMNYMFHEAYTFDQDLSDWCVLQITSQPNNFVSGNTPLSPSNFPLWGTCP